MMVALGWRGLEWPKRKEEQKKGPVQCQSGVCSTLKQQAVLYLLSLKDPCLVMAFGEEKEGVEPLILSSSMSQGSRESELFYNPIFSK